MFIKLDCEEKRSFDKLNFPRINGIKLFFFSSLTAEQSKLERLFEAVSFRLV